MDDFGFRSAESRESTREITSIPLNACEVRAFVQAVLSLARRDGFTDLSASMTAMTVVMWIK